MSEIRKTLGLFVAFALLAIVGQLRADTGSLNAVRKAIGNAANTYQFTGSSFTGTTFFVAESTRPDGVGFNNSSTIVWVGSVTATTLLTVIHNNIARGLPLSASSYFRLDGSFLGSLNFTCDANIPACEVRTFESVTEATAR